MSTTIRSFVLIVFTIVCLTMATTVFFLTRKHDSSSSQLGVNGELMSAGGFKGPWSECLGLSGQECKDILINDGIDSDKIKIVLQDSMVTGDWDEDRVRIWVNNAGVVITAPGRG
mmetsp:Transcript_33676/g.49115  ORF Transcript_33676/g.49115 Transcript_33676/m.49115 type:complete len:115 (-) Transcript_33676:211-555(-)